MYRCVCNSRLLHTQFTSYTYIYTCVWVYEYIYEYTYINTYIYTYKYIMYVYYLIYVYHFIHSDICVYMLTYTYTHAAPARHSDVWHHSNTLKDTWLLCLTATMTLYSPWSPRELFANNLCVYKHTWVYQHRRSAEMNSPQHALQCVLQLVLQCVHQHTRSAEMDSPQHAVHKSLLCVRLHSRAGQLAVKRRVSLRL